MRTFEGGQAMRYPVFMIAAAVLGISFLGEAWSQDKKVSNAEVKAKLIADYNDLSTRLVEWQDTVQKIQKRLERSKSPTDIELARRLRQANESMRASAAIASQVFEAFADADIDNPIHLHMLAGGVSTIRQQLSNMARALRDDLGHRDQRLAFFNLQKSLSSLATEQWSLNDTDNEDNLAKNQASITARTKELAALAPGAWQHREDSQGI
jgi:uncharacterized phage infection (PIP) family protein YhgE